jgi:hypothetical protein
MRADLHQRARALTDRAIVEGIPADEQRWLDGHVAGCGECSHYRDLSQRAVRALDSFAFDYDAAAALRVESLVLQYSGPRQSALAPALAIVLTILGSLLMWQIAGELASRWGVSPRLWQTWFVVLWLLPSAMVDLVLIFRRRLLPADVAAEGRSA